MKVIDTFLFDLDGTLIDTIDLILASYRHTIKQFNKEPLPDEAWIQQLGKPLWIQFELFSRNENEIQDMVVVYKKYMLEQHDAMIRLYPDVVEVVQSLADQGKKLGVVTSKLRVTTDKALELFKLDRLFEIVVTAEDVEKAKPNPEPVLKVLNALNADPQQAVMIGDSPFDIRAAKAAGVSSAAVLWGPFKREQLELEKPDHFFHQLTDITDTFL